MGPHSLIDHQLPPVNNQLMHSEPLSVAIRRKNGIKNLPKIYEFSAGWLIELNSNSMAWGLLRPPHPPR